MQTMRTQSEMLYSLQVGRAMAVIAVVLDHSIMTSLERFKHMPIEWYQAFRLGYLGVDYFFVLSGFIIAHSSAKLTMTSPADAKIYTLSRFIRIYLPYAPVSFAMVLGFTLIPSLSMGVGNQFSWVGSLLLLPSDALPALTVARTLQHEVMFYFLFGVCYFYFKRPALIFLWAVPILILLAFEFPRTVTVIAGQINLEFLFGVAAYRAYQAGHLSGFRHVLLALGVSIVLIASTILFNDGEIDNYRVLAGAGFAAIVLGLVFIERDVDFSRYRLLVFLGGVSYSIYLVHNPTLSIMLRVIPKMPHWAADFLVFAAGSTLVGVLYHFVIEKPVIAHAKALFMRRAG